MTHSDWGDTLLAEVQLLKGSDTEAKYAEAHEKILCAKTIIDKTSYNLACLLALTGERDQAGGLSGGWDVEGCCAFEFRHGFGWASGDGWV